MFGKLKVAVLVGQMVFGGLDARITRGNITHGGREYDPFVKPLAHSKVIYAEFPMESFAYYWIGKRLERRHPKLSKMLFAQQGVDLAGHLSGWLYTREHTR